ncbi:MAG: DUF4097 family beta strand repeat protein [Clostridia bacterium]|nr:DUF4097 family beta strand repeat protein [Clostridia bacterium]
MDDERRLILKMLEDGKISAEEAVELLNALEGFEEGESLRHRPGEGRRPARVRDVSDIAQEIAERLQAEGERWERVGEEIAERVTRSVHRLGFPFFSFGPRAEEVSEWSHAAPEGGPLTLAVSIRNGSVRVVGEDRPDVHVRLECAAQAATEEAARAAARAMGEVEWRDGTLVVAEGAGQGGPWGVRRMRVRIAVPKGVPVAGRVESRNGSLGCQGLVVPEGRSLALVTTNASVEVADVRGGSVEARTTNGSVRVRAVDADLAAGTTNGSVRVQLDAPSRDREVSLRTANGSVRVALPETGGLDVSARTVAGSVRSEFPELGTGARVGAGRHLEGRREGSPRIRLTAETRNGSVRLLRATSQEGEEVAAGG